MVFTTISMSCKEVWGAQFLAHIKQIYKQISGTEEKKMMVKFKFVTYR